MQFISASRVHCYSQVSHKLHFSFNEGRLSVCASTDENAVLKRSEWIAKLPLVLIMGMATSGEAIQNLLPGSAARHLHLHNFMLPSPNEYLEGILKGVLLKPTPVFTIGSEVLNYLLIHYQKYDSTVTSFVRALKVCSSRLFIV